MGARGSCRAAALFALLLLGCSETGSDRRDAGPRPDAGPLPAWRTVAGVPTKEDLFDVWGRSANDVFIAGWGGTIAHFDGLSWTLETTTSTQPLTAVHGAPAPADSAAPGPVFAVGWKGTILERRDGGRWVDGDRTSPVAEDLFALFAGGPRTALAAGDAGRLVLWDGTSWRPANLVVRGEFSGEPIRPKSALKGAWSGPGERYFVTGSGGAAYRSEDGLATFQALDTRVSEPLRGVWGTANDNVYTVGLDALILRFGGEWSRVREDGAELLPRVFFFDVAGASEDDLTVVGWRGVVARFQGGTWAEEATGIEADLRAVWIDATTRVAYAVGASGTVIRRDPPPAPPP